MRLDFRDRASGLWERAEIRLRILNIALSRFKYLEESHVHLGLEH